ncbi:MAG: hypothetical protein NBKEAIPA_00072 [Nitrospirae bacterium]|nr:MAG: hypothetical protein UZ03_NOB001000972 [Nitrospira sp. OLB3]MBV6468208.1 hypothetical protein [Nitrospirota bacterium]MCE7966874.1 hypothetical protein [Nitrospira sp. NTP2]MCK6493744.1 hypothetical protein [Nitrospira sp.]MEB2337439.1 hypothetical protein [Nitrospirales bacterium]
MRQVAMAVGMGVVVVLVQGCAAPAKQAGHETVALAEGRQTSLSDEEFVKNVERHIERQDRPGTTLRFR